MKKFLGAFCNFSYWQSRCHVLIVIACLSLAAVGQMPDSSAGWVLVLPTPIAVARKKKPTKGDRRRRARQKYRNNQKTEIRQALVAHHAKTTWLVPTLRTITLAGSFVFLNSKWLILSIVPVWLWLIQLLTLLYPKTNQPEVKAIKWMARRAEQALMLVVISTLVSQGMIYFIDFLSMPESTALLAASAVIITGAGSTVTLETKVDSDGNKSYHATLSGNFELSVEATEASDVEASKASDTKLRLLILLLRQLEVPGYKRAGRHTRDGRTPFVSGAALAKAYSVQNSKISLRHCILVRK